MKTWFMIAIIIILIIGGVAVFYAVKHPYGFSDSESSNVPSQSGMSDVLMGVCMLEA